MRAKNTFEPYARVPDGATLQVWVSEDTDSFLSNAQALSTGPDGASWTHAVLKSAAGARKTLSGQNYYWVEIRVEFTSPSEKKAKAHTKITYVDDEGKTRNHSTPYTWEFTGKKNDPEKLCGVIITTSRS